MAAAAVAANCADVSGHLSRESWGELSTRVESAPELSDLVREPRDHLTAVARS